MSAPGSHCPAWCTADHSGDVIEHQGDNLFDGRWFHSHRLGVISPAEGGYDIVVKRELTTEADGTPSAPEVIFLHSDVGLSPDEAERLAHLLLEAAADLRRAALRPV